jgi:hypothetical protein
MSLKLKEHLKLM